jgi:hypothetical protein
MLSIMKTIASVLLLAVLSSYTLRTSCDTSYIFGKWLLVDAYDEGTVAVDSLLKTEIKSHKRSSLKFLRGQMVQNDQGDYTNTEMYTLDRGRCRIEFRGITTTELRNFDILYLDEHYLIGLERSKIYFYEKEE